jgi:ribonuclease P protein component
VAGYGFHSRYRLIKTDEFSSVFSFRRRIFGKLLTMHCMPNQQEFPRVGIVVSKKTARRAVARNYMRRVLREWFRTHRQGMGALDIVIRVQKPFARDEFHVLQDELQQLLTRLQRESANMQKKLARVEVDGTSPDLAG